MLPDRTVECFIRPPVTNKRHPAPEPRRVTFYGWTRAELMNNLPQVAAALDVDLSDIDFDTLVVRNVREKNAPR